MGMSASQLEAARDRAVVVIADFCSNAGMNQASEARGQYIDALIRAAEFLANEIRYTPQSQPVDLGK